MPASEAGAGKGKQAEAANCAWNEKARIRHTCNGFGLVQGSRDEHGERLVVSSRGVEQYDLAGGIDDLLIWGGLAPSCTSVPEVANLCSTVNRRWVFYNQG